MSLPRILLPGKGRSVSIGTGTRCTFKVTGKDTKGRFGLFTRRFEESTKKLGERAKARFYCENFVDRMDARLP